jgi:tetratricopeptide (TPR) repeat protein
LHQGVVAHGSGAIDRAIDLYEQALRLAGGGGPTAVTLEYLGRALIRKGELAQGATRLEEALALNAGNGFQEGIVRAMLGLAYLACAVGLDEEAARLCASAETLRVQIGLRPIAFPEKLDYDEALETARGRLSEHVFAAAWTAGQSRTLSESSRDIQAILDRARETKQSTD